MKITRVEVVVISLIGLYYCVFLQEEISDSLEKILKDDRRQAAHNDETYIQLYLDIIQVRQAYVFMLM